MCVCSEVVRSPNEARPILWDVAKPTRKLPHHKKNIRYANGICAFDIETYTFNAGMGERDYQAAMYLWQLQIDIEYTILGRTWDEFRACISTLTSMLDEDVRLLIYVHNLSYEFQFLKSIIPVDRVFARDERKIVSFESGPLEFRCSYCHSNMSLAEYTQKMNVKHQKLADTMAYDAERWSDTELDEKTLRYGVYDVMGLVEALYAEMEGEDDLYTMPLTSTGYVRRDAKKVLHDLPQKIREGLKPPYEVYLLERQAFRGGDTHANRYYAGKILENVRSVDISSSYPSQQVGEEYPVGEWIEEEHTLRRVFELMRHHRPFLIRVRFENLRLADDAWGCPYLPFSKCAIARDYVLDNGRILECASCITTLTDVDWGIFLEEYIWDGVEVLQLYSSRYSMLPEPYRELVLRYYRDKTGLKGVEGREVYYMKQKNRINSFYGMSAQNPIIDEYVYNGELRVLEREEVDDRGAYNKAKIWMPYAWGVWCTAHARKALHEGIKLAGLGFVYCDTDSVKYIGNADFGDFNRRIVERDVEWGCLAEDRKGKTHYMGLYEEEDGYSQFCTWGAKKYAGVQNGRLVITVSGVNKRAGADELEAAGGLAAFKPGFIFRKGGGLEAIYNDLVEPRQYLRADGKVIDITSNVALVPSTYTLGLSDNYLDLLGRLPVDKCGDWVYNSIKGG